MLLDFSNLSTPTNLVNSASPLSLGGGMLQINGQAGGAVATAQTFASLTANATNGGASGIALALNGVPPTP